MTTIQRPILLAASLLLVSAVGAVAQTNNPGTSGGTRGSQVAIPQYPPGEGSNPALTTGRLRGATGVPADENPRVPGATGDTIVRGDNSTIRGDRRATIEEKTGVVEGK